MKMFSWIKKLILQSMNKNKTFSEIIEENDAKEAQATVKLYSELFLQRFPKVETYSDCLILWVPKKDDDDDDDDEVSK